MDVHEGSIRWHYGGGVCGVMRVGLGLLEWKQVELWRWCEKLCRYEIGSGITLSNSMEVERRAKKMMPVLDL